MISCLGREDSMILTFADIWGLCDIDQEFSYSKKSKNFRSPRIDYTETIYRIDYKPYIYRIDYIYRIVELNRFQSN